MYMSYCRHEGTLSELRAVLSDATEHINGEAEDEVSDREIHCFRKLVSEFCDWLSDNELLDEDGYLDDDRLDEICEAMSRKCEDEPEVW